MGTTLLSGFPGRRSEIAALNPHSKHKKDARVGFKMVARDSFGSATFEGEEAGTSTGYGKSAEEMDDIEEELQVLAC